MRGRYAAWRLRRPPGRLRPAQLAGQPEKIQQWATQEMKDTAHAAQNMGVDVATFFMGPPVWKPWYPFPQASEAQIEAGYQKARGCGDPSWTGLTPAA